jgi:hypothetical protein
MSRSYSPDEMATPRDPSCEPRENEPALHRASPELPCGHLVLRRFRPRNHRSFLTHLAAYRPLFRHIQTFRFLYISPTDAQFSRATERFRAVVKQPLESDMKPAVLKN